MAVNSDPPTPQSSGWFSNDPRGTDGRGCAGSTDFEVIAMCDNGAIRSGADGSLTNPGRDADEFQIQPNS